MDIKELEIFDQKQLSGKSSAAPTITVNPKNGNINFNASAIIQSGVSDGQRIAFSRNKSNGTWYMMKLVNDEVDSGFVLRVYSDKGKASFTCKSLVLELLKDHKIKGDHSHRFTIDTETPPPAGDYMCYVLDHLKKTAEAGK